MNLPGTYRVRYRTPNGTLSTQIVHALSLSQALATIGGSIDADTLALGPLDIARYLASITGPGGSQTAEFLTAREAWKYLADQRVDDEDDWDDSDTYSATVDQLTARISSDAPGTVTAPTPDHATGLPAGLTYSVTEA